MKDDMRGLFFIVKGQYSKGARPSVVNTSGDVSYLGGYDPLSDDTKEWYQVIDNTTFNCVACGGDLDSVLRSLSNLIKKHKGSLKRYLKFMKHYSTGVSPSMREFYKHLYEEYGDFFNDLVCEVVENTYIELVEERPVNKSKRLLAKNKIHKEDLEMNTKKEDTPVETLTLKKVKPKVKLGVKKLKLE